MGLISELHDIRAEMTFAERQKIERENKKTLQENYKKEIIGDLQELFYSLFKSLPYKEAYKKAILEKDKNIDKITRYIENLDYKKDGKTFYLYDDKFDIVQDLQDNYNKILNKTAKDFETIETYKKAEILERLENYLIERFENAERLQSAVHILTQQKYIDYIINDIAQTPEEAETIQQNYYKTLQKVINQYKYNIQEEKQQEKAIIRAEKERQKIKRRDRIAFLYLINKILS